ncbi:hypothetical protein EDB83DRAFT_2678114 [Lactarius deliciosus]|nr:hypothetical protein EDB83DRAFT_2678114 [Lactarius deliciosus]
MSQRNGPIPFDEFNIPEPGTGNNQYPPNASTQNQDGETNFSDGSEPLFSMYLERAEEEDKKKAESWQGDAEGILVFTGLFSAAVATLLSVSVQDLKQNSQDISAFYLANVYQLLSNQNGSQITVVIPSSLSDPTSFTPPVAAVWVNSLWFLSLVISLTCALLATLLQQWARRYLRITNPRCSPHKRARIRAFFAEGVERLRLPWTVEALPTLLHISLFLFFAGLGVFLFGIHRTVFSVVIAWVGLCIVVYAYLTALPILHKDSPYHAPLSSFFWFCVTGMRYAVFPSRDTPTRHNSTTPGAFSRDRDLEEDRNRSLFQHGLLKTAEEHAGGLTAEIDYRALEWTFDSLDEDRELEQFFDGVPGFCGSNAVDNPVAGFVKPNSRKLSNALTGLMDRTLSSSLVSELVKQKRITICTKAIGAANLFGPWWVLPRVLVGDWQAFLRSIDFGLFLKDWTRVDRPITTFYAQCAVSVIISSVQTPARDDRWLRLVTRQINVSKSVLRSYLDNGDSILLANLTHIIRQTLRTRSVIEKHHEGLITEASSRALESISKLDARDSLPELQHEFCGLWNQLVHVAQHNEHLNVQNVSLATLKNVRKVYIALHEHTVAHSTAFATTDDGDAALDVITSYPICTIPGHEPTHSGGLSDLLGQATQPPVPLPSPILPSHGPVSSPMPIAFPTPSPSPPLQSQAQAFLVHHGASPTVLCNSAPQASSTYTSIAPGPAIPVPQTLLAAGPYVAQPIP